MRAIITVLCRTYLYVMAALFTIGIIGAGWTYIVLFFAGSNRFSPRDVAPLLATGILCCVANGLLGWIFWTMGGRMLGLLVAVFVAGSLGNIHVVLAFVAFAIVVLGVLAMAARDFAAARRLGIVSTRYVERCMIGWGVATVFLILGATCYDHGLSLVTIPPKELLARYAAWVSHSRHGRCGAVRDPLCGCAVENPPRPSWLTQKRWTLWTRWTVWTNSVHWVHLVHRVHIVHPPAAVCIAPPSSPQ